MAYNELFQKILGPAATVDSLDALGGDPAQWVANFRRYEPQHYAYGKAQGSRYWEVANYYDRVKIYYQWHAADAANAEQWLAKANELALNYRDTYVDPNKGDVSAHWNMAPGVALHHVVTGDPVSKTWIVNVAGTMAAPYYVNNLGNLGPQPEILDNRIQARCIESWLLAWLFTGDAKWSNYLRNGLRDILKTQKPDGSYPFLGPQNGHNKPFMIGLLNDALIFYERAFEPDSRIKPSIAAACDNMWANQWVESAKAFMYSPGEPGDGMTPAADLNMLIVGGYVYCGMADQAKQILAGSMSTWFEGDKQFNQNYCAGFTSLAQLPGAVSAWGDLAPPDPGPDPEPEPPAVDVTQELLAAQAAIAEEQAVLARVEEAKKVVRDAPAELRAANQAAAAAIDAALAKLA